MRWNNISSKTKDWHVLEFITPISENASINDNFIIRGTAINETTTHNNHKYIAEELEKAAPSLVGRPLLVDHDNRVESIKGKVNDSYYDSLSKSIKFEAKVMDTKIKEMIKDGRISNVSIGAFAEDLIKEESTGALIAKGLKIVELSLVAVPADNQATFASAMANNFQIKESLEIAKEEIKDESYLLGERRIGQMTEKKEALQESESSEKSQKILEENVKLQEELKALKEEKRNALIESYNKLCEDKKVNKKDMTKASEETMKSLIEQLKEITVREEKKELKSQVVQEVPKELEDFVFESSSEVRGLGVWKMPDSNRLRQLHTNLPFKINGS